MSADGSSYLDQCWRVVTAGRLLERQLGLVGTVAGRGADDSLDSFSLEMYGRMLFYNLAYVEGMVAVLAAPLDSPPALRRLLQTRADLAGYTSAVSLIRALERSGLSDLSPHPLLIGSPG